MQKLNLSLAILVPVSAQCRAPSVERQDTSQDGFPGYFILSDGVNPNVKRHDARCVGLLDVLWVWHETQGRCKRLIPLIRMRACLNRKAQTNGDVNFFSRSTH